MSDSTDNLRNVDYLEKVSVVTEHSLALKREKPDPLNGSEPLSLWTFFLAALVFLVGGGYIGANTGGKLFSSLSQYTSTGYQPLPAPRIGPEKESGPWIDRWMNAGRKGYKGTCASCHQETGKGQAGLYPPLAGSEYVVGGSKRMAKAVLNGLQGPITVAGSSFNGVMQPWKTLPDEQLAQIMTYVRRSWGNAEKLAKGDDGIVTKEMIGEAKATLSQNAACTAADIATDDGNLPGAKVDPLTGEPLAGAAP